MEQTLHQVLEFHKAFNHPIGTEANMFLNKGIAELRYKLILEERNELESAIKNDDIIEIIDALCDLKYVINGTIICHGVHWGFTDFKSILFSTINSDDKNFIFHLNQYAYNQSLFKDSRIALNILYSITAMDVICDRWIKCFISTNFEDYFNEVHSSNMSKLDKEGKPIYREDGKVMKSDLYFKPDLKKIYEIINNPDKTKKNVKGKLARRF